MEVRDQYLITMEGLGVREAVPVVVILGQFLRGVLAQVVRVAMAATGTGGRRILCMVLRVVAVVKVPLGLMRLAL